MERLDAMQGSYSAFGAYSRYCSMFCNSHIHTASSTKWMSARLAKKAAKDVLKTVEVYREALTDIERMYDSGIPDKVFVDCCTLFTFMVNGRLTDIQRVHEQYKPVEKHARANNLKSMIKRG